MRIINASQVRELLPMDECIDAMDQAMRAVSAGEVSIPPRIIMPLHGTAGFLGAMPGSAGSPRIDGAKLISQHAGNPARGLPAIQGFVALFDPDNGTPRALVDGAEITGIRTAAASGLATRLLARSDARSHGILGTGVQAVTHIDAIAASRDIEETLIWGRDFSKARSLAHQQAERTGRKYRAVDSPELAAGCDIVTTVTAAAEPILMGAWIHQGTHVNLVGAHSPDSREADSELMATAFVYCDLTESLFNESGDVLIPLNEGRMDRSQIRGEIGSLAAGDIPGRQNPDEITVYKSLGITAQDLFAAQLVLEKALARDVGEEVTL
ncbi:MAG: ornithine cyclodeaminase family protein [Xanthomonadales bacterium]|nr:ornithine cyclodeaminase family protein [Xanthomonadales bacterium]